MITVQPRYSHNPKKAKQQLLKMSDIETRFKPQQDKSVERNDYRNKGKDVTDNIFICPECNTTFEVYPDSYHGGFLYEYLPNEFPRRGLKHRVCEECVEAKESFDKIAADDKMRGVRFTLNRRNVRRLIGRSLLALKSKKVKYSNG